MELARRLFDRVRNFLPSLLFFFLVCFFFFFTAGVVEKSDFLFSRSKYGMQAIFPLSRARVGGVQ